MSCPGPPWRRLAIPFAIADQDRPIQPQLVAFGLSLGCAGSLTENLPHGVLTGEVKQEERGRSDHERQGSAAASLRRMNNSILLTPMSSWWSEGSAGPNVKARHPVFSSPERSSRSAGQWRTSAA